MTAFNPIAAAANPNHGQQAAAARAQAVAPELPLPDRIRALEMAFHELHLRAVTAGSAYIAADSEYSNAQHVAGHSGNPDATPAYEVAEARRSAQATIDGLELERANLLRQWTELGVGWEIPFHGLPHTNPVRDVFEIQRPTPLPPEELRRRLEGGLNSLRQSVSQLQDEHARDPALGLARRQAEYRSILEARVAMLRQWSAGRLGDDVPPHGVRPDVGPIFADFERADRAQVLAHS
jgi:hypothetical protein